MSKFNTTTKGTSAVINHEGEVAYKLTAELELYSAVVTSFVSNKFYEAESDQLTRIKTLIAKVNPTFVAKLAIYAREQMHLRSIPLVLLVELAKIHRGNSIIGSAVEKVIQRADEITELLSYYEKSNNRTELKKLNRISNQLVKGLKKSFNNFNEYNFAKYNRDSSIKLKDALFLVHPKPKNDEQQKIFDKIAANTLEIPYTWETELSKIGQQKFDTDAAKALAFKQKWEELIDSKKVGYMATLRNLRNILEADVSKEHIIKVATRLSTKDEVLKSKQLPFRFLSAYNEISPISSGHVSILLEALEEAIKVSVENVKGFGFDTSVLIACDTSGSMQTPISPKSSIQNYDIGLLLGMLLQSKCKDVTSGIFGDTWKIINLPRTNVLSNVAALQQREGEVGYSTNGYLVIQDLISRNRSIDKIMIFTDCQLWDSSGYNTIFSDLWNKYKKISPKSKLYLFDLAGYGNTPVSTNNKDVYFIAGWSDKVFDILEAVDNGSSAIKEIEKIVI